jgi:hypothetical protein
MEGSGSGPILRYDPDSCLEGLGKSTEILRISGLPAEV